MADERYARLLLRLADGWQLWTSRGLHGSTYLRTPEGARHAEHLHYGVCTALERRGWVRRAPPGPMGREWRITPKGRRHAEELMANPPPTLRERAVALQRGET